MDSSFCVAKGVVELKKKGVYGDTLAKKRRYWPKRVPSGDIAAHFSSKEVGEMESLRTQVDGKTMWVHCMKEADYVTKIVSNHGTLMEVENATTFRRCKGADGKDASKYFAYTDPFERCHRGPHVVDDDNNRWHDPISFEESWATKWWPHRQQAWHMAVAEVNACNVKGKARGDTAEPQLVFRRLLVKEILNNDLDDRGRPSCGTSSRPKRGVNRIVAEHKLETQPIFARVWQDGDWTKVKKKYQQMKCRCGFFKGATAPVTGQCTCARDATLNTF
uniref:PiggyBac transposable element-derived protein domain-containing protein n=1 Tax=Odontella aurita TaxID=265563 RepID=A0A7S4KC53_9STRA|mmetsp:Transcript_8515/g.25713  ORF Transcript_8515/g.25713 Transcript_8515/m.25713 type:complete len:276 (+) Transcript_8515:628-1455(+)